MQLGRDQRPGLNRMRREWEERDRWVKNHFLWIFSGFAIGIGVTNLPSQGAILSLALGCAVIIAVPCFLFIRWIRLKTLNKKIRDL